MSAAPFLRSKLQLNSAARQPASLRPLTELLGLSLCTGCSSGLILTTKKTPARLGSASGSTPQQFTMQNEILTTPSFFSI